MIWIKAPKPSYCYLYEFLLFPFCATPLALVPKEWNAIFMVFILNTSAVQAMDLSATFVVVSKGKQL